MKKGYQDYLTDELFILSFDSNCYGSGILKSNVRQRIITHKNGDGTYYIAWILLIREKIKIPW